MWNIDSIDWGDPVPSSIVRRVLAQTEQQRRGIALFHDIHEQTAIALPRLIAAWRQAGFQFADPSRLSDLPARR